MSDAVAAAHPALMHYTTCAGLKGIVESTSLWASNARYLNDSQEIVHYFEARLPILVQSVAEEYLRRLGKDKSKAEKIESLGGIRTLVNKQTDALVSHLRDNTLRYLDPFLLSLSAPADELVLSNGLLSQWRAYGSDGGYAIILNGEELARFLRDEEQTHHYQHLEWGDVFYYGAKEPQAAKDDIEEAENSLKDEIFHMIDTGSPRDHMRVYFALTTLACLSKHWGFQEEREVRVVAIPQRDSSNIVNTNSSGREKKVVRHYQKGGTLVPYLALTGKSGSTSRLPIEAVIIGPHKDKSLRKSATENLLKENGYDVPVSVSEIPYVGR